MWPKKGNPLAQIAPKMPSVTPHEAVNNYLKTGDESHVGKFAPLIKGAAARGPQALSVMTSMLSNHPDFKKQIGIKD